MAQVLGREAGEPAGGAGAAAALAAGEGRVALLRHHGEQRPGGGELQAGATV